MRRPTCNCIKEESDKNKEIVSLWNSVNVAEVNVTYGNKMVWLPVKFCPQCGKPYVEFEVGIDFSTQNDFTHWMPLPEPPETTREDAGHWDGIAPEQDVSDED